MIERDGLSQKSLCKRAALRGYPEISPPRITKLLNGENPDHEQEPIQEYPQPDSIEGLSAALDVDYQMVLDAITRTLGRPKVWRSGSKEPVVIVDHDMPYREAIAFGRRIRGIVRPD
ncbi:MAG TPA: hypothetical protein VFW65_31880 [Pseudonocardiaceae bacterium]|nr:hypothetical protein [Pseudonocardiaceae bacterium]